LHSRSITRECALNDMLENRMRHFRRWPIANVERHLNLV
jgi:hypothetical protein